MSIKSWYPILNWKKLPNFGNCHSIENVDDFALNFVDTPEIDIFRGNLLETLTGHFEQLNVRIVGCPGSGKTTFIYSLLKLAHVNGYKILEKYCIYIFHTNRAASANENEIVHQHILAAWEKYYEACGQAGMYKLIEGQRIPVKTKISKLMDHYKGNRKLFEKVLIFVLEDADLITQEQVVSISHEVYRNLEVSSIKKWIVLRESTFEGYSEKSRQDIASFFPDLHTFPSTQLFDVVEKRIQWTAESDHAKNPFSRPLCNIICRLHDGNFREALSTLKKLLQDNSASSDIAISTSAEFIQKYLERISIKTLVNENQILNLHDSALRNTPYPLPFDIACVCQFIQEQALVFRAVDEVQNERLRMSGVPAKDFEFRLRQDQFDYSVEALVSKGILKKTKSNSLHLTNVGQILATYATRGYYNDHCLGTAEPPLTAHYKKLVSQTPEHESLVLRGTLWQRV